MGEIQLSNTDEQLIECLFCSKLSGTEAIVCHLRISKTEASFFQSFLPHVRILLISVKIIKMSVRFKRASCSPFIKKALENLPLCILNIYLVTGTFVLHTSPGPDNSSECFAIFSHVLGEI